MKKLENKRMYGQTDTLNVIRINNVAVTPTITSTVSTDKTVATYIITVKDDVNQIDAVITSQLKAVKNTLYTLTETGKQKEQTIAVVDGKVTLKALSKTPYVIHKGSKANLDVKWSEHMHVVDGNFNSANLNAWTIMGEKAGASLVKSTGNLDMLTFTNTKDEVALTQDITDLKPGVKYAAYVGVDNRSDAKAYIEVDTLVLLC